MDARYLTAHDVDEFGVFGSLAYTANAGGKGTPLDLGRQKWTMQAWSARGLPACCKLPP